MIKSFSDHLVPYFVCVLKHAGYREADSIELERGEFFRPTEYQLIVNEKNENETPDIFNDAKLVNVNIIGNGSEASLNYLSIMLNRIVGDNPLKTLSLNNMKKYINTYGRN